MVSQAALSMIPSLPPIPPTQSQPYAGEQATASVRASLQKALDGYTPGNITLIVANATPADLKHTRSFGVTHAQELSLIGTGDPTATNIPITPPPTSAAAPPPTSYAALPPSPVVAHTSTSPLSQPIPIQVSTLPKSPVLASAPSPGNTSPPLNPANLNQAPAPIPIHAAATSPVVAPDPSDPTTKVPSVTPTVAETGVPKVAGPDGPGPASGSLLDKKASSPPSISALPPSQFESAEEEKKRLQREEREKLLQGDTSGAGAPAPYESAEEEKKRLEREERERILLQSSSATGEKPPGEDDGDLPPYQEF